MSSIEFNSSAEEIIASPEYQERLQRDLDLTNRIKAGYTPADPSMKNPHPRIIDGTLDQDGTEALGELHFAYERLCIKIASKTARRHDKSPSITTEDLAQEALFGIYHSALKWSSEKNISFLTYASPKIKHYLDRYVDDHETAIRIPSGTRDQVRKYGSTIWKIYQTTESIPFRERVASAMGIPPNKVDQIAAWEAETAQMGSIDKGYFSDGRDRHSTFDMGEGKWRSAVPGASEMKAVEDEVMVNAIVDIVQETLRPGEEGLSKQEVDLLRARFFGVDGSGPMTLDESGKIHGISGERVREIEARTLAKLRNPSRSNKLRGLLREADETAQTQDLT